MMKQNQTKQTDQTHHPLARALDSARCTQPFNELGIHDSHDGGGKVIRAWLPDAVAVKVSDLSTSKLIGEMERVDSSGLFELVLSRRKTPFNYFLRVSYSGASEEIRIVDPYQFAEEAYQAVHYVDSEPVNVYRQLGAQLRTLYLQDDKKVEGVQFAVFAPNATAVSLIGDFNHWDGRRHPMQKTRCGHWVLFVPGLCEGTRYKYELKDAIGNSLPHKADPVGFLADQYPSHASVIFDHNRYQWHDHEWLDEQRETNLYQSPMSIYEVHLGSWKRRVEEGNRWLSYRELAEELIPYVKEMGFTHIEVMPVSEHPFNGSWGYQPVGLFAPTSRFGRPDDFKFFVDQCHQNGIGVIIDWVPAHFPNDGHGLARFDGSTVYEYEDARRGWHPDWNSCIYDYGKDTVRSFLLASALFWLEQYHIDGLRVDAVASMLYLDYSRNEGEWIPNVDGGNVNYEAVSFLKWMNEEVYRRFPHAMTIAEESTSYARVSKPVFEGGLGFGFKWNMGWMHDSLTYISKDPAYRRYHHGDITFSMIYAYDENFILPVSHDEVVHGKGSLLRKMPGDEWQQAANQRCYAAYMYAHPGKKLNFMGNELAQSSEWNHDSSLDWHLLEYDKHKKMQQLYRDLNLLYRDTPALHEQDHTPGGFAWLDHEDADHSLLAFVRRAKTDAPKVYVLCNFTPVPREQYVLGVEDAGKYRVLLNTDSEDYFGSDYDLQLQSLSVEKPWHNCANSITLNVPPLATVYLIYDERSS